MSKLIISRLVLIFLTFSLTCTVSEAQSFARPGSHRLQKKVRNKPLRSRTVKIREPRAAEKAKKKAEATDRKNKREYEKFVRENRERSFEIQTPAVRERMKQNVKSANAKYKAKRKKASSRSRKVAKKYRK
ncbi:MAG TPA: hypothetical protein PLR52_00075 [Bacteroidales bacterium]|nr:hypothetical protein [Bacteroidales bacterium]HPI67810.1 hypothetical protein [Bacteroidales bacterium]HPR72351.1 hypothetical protein [Bacteroidales bacterium]